MMPRAVIQALETHLPARVVTNEEIASHLELWSAEEIFNKTGIRERRFSRPEECASDLAVQAAVQLLEKNRLDPQEIDYLLFCTQSPDYFLPASACLIQERLGLNPACGALDLNQGCSGYVFGLSLAKGLIESRQAQRILLLTGETYSKFLNVRDRSVLPLFGDGATATIICASDRFDGIGEFVFGTNGNGGKNLIVPAGGLRCPVSEETGREETDKVGNVRSLNNLYMNGPEIFRFAIKEVPQTIHKLLSRSRLELEDIDYVVLHQANKYMMDELIRRIPIAREKCPYEFEDVGNTVSSSIPIALQRMRDQDMLQPGTLLLLFGFGVGYSQAGCIVRWSGENP